MSGFIGHLNVLIIRLSGRIEAMATAMFDNAGSPRRRDDAARDEFTAEFTAGLDPAVRRQPAHRNRRHHTEW